MLSKYINPAPVDIIILVANVYEKTQYYNISKEQLRIEFFNEKELNQIIFSLQQEKYKLKVYFDEIDFIKDVLCKNLKITENSLVFNLARNGSGVSKKALIPTFCDLMKIKYTGSNGYACSLARNKYHVSKLLEAKNLHGIPSNLYLKGNWFLDERPKPNSEVIIKPLYESASKYITTDNIINTSDIDFEMQLDTYSDKIKSPVLVQDFIRGYEAKIPIFQLNTITAFSPVGIMINGNTNLNNKIITEDLSYHYNYTNYFLEDVLEESLIKNIQKNAIDVFKLLGLENYGRIDCRIDNNGRYYFYDFATMPYFTEHSELFFNIQNNNLTQGKLFNIIFNSALYNKYHIL